MIIDGVRYAVDLNNNNQYTLSFIDGVNIYIHVRNDQGEMIFPERAIHLAVDDAPINDQDDNRATYKIVFDKDTTSSVSVHESGQKDLPAHHPDGADIARAAYNSWDGAALADIEASIEDAVKKHAQRQIAVRAKAASAALTAKLDRLDQTFPRIPRNKGPA